MPIIRKLIDLGNSRGITLPKSWIKDHEKNKGKGKTLVSVAMTVNGTITISPHKFEKEVNE